MSLEMKVGWLDRFQRSPQRVVELHQGNLDGSLARIPSSAYVA
jgi:hypothetical protein